MGHWYYGENGQQIGPVDENSIRAAIHEGRLGAQTLVWREGMASWLPLDQVHELAMAPVIPGGYPASPYATYGGYVQNFSPTSGLSIASMVCGILGLITCVFLLGIPAVICGHMAMKQINDNALPMGGRGMAISGLVMGYIQILAFVVFGVWVTIMTLSQ